MVLADLSSFDPTQTLIGGAGVAGIWVIMFLAGRIHSDKSVEFERQQAEEELIRLQGVLEAERQRTEAELARLRALVDTLLAVYHTEILPTLGDYEKRLAPALARVEDVMKRQEWIISEYERRGRGAFATEEVGRYEAFGPPPPHRAGRPDPFHGDRGGVGQGAGPGGGPATEGGSP
jgi:hypothetical protein